jgi:hypothetical protein
VSTLSAGLRLHDRFVLVERIGVGGMAQVWRAHDEVLDRPVAVKLLDAAVGSDATIRIATHREARAAARLNHPHITRVYDYGEAALPGGTVAPYLVMELLDGRSLAERLASGPVPWPEAARIAAQVAAGLAAAHASGIVHCDIKPGNVMLTSAGAKILDFGVASLAGRPDTTGELIYGTPGYLPPERMAGAPPQPAGDVYALGVLLADMVTGRKPDHEPAPLAFPAAPVLPPAVVRLGSACLATDPAARPGAAELSRALAAAAGTRPAPTVASAPTSPAPAVPGVPGVPAPRVAAATMVARTAAGAPIRGRAAVVPKTPPVDPTIGWVEDLGPARRRGASGGLLALGAVTVLVLVLLVGMLLSQRTGSQGSADNTAQPPVATSSAEPGAGGAAAQDTGGNALPRSLSAALSAIETAARIANATGRLDDDAMQRIDDKVADLRTAVRSDDARKARKEARDLLNAIDDLSKDGKIDPDVRDALGRLIAPFVQNQGQNEG